jgi:uracil-DNA glycosylase family 4
MDSDERRTLIRSVRQRLEGLSRAGVDRIALPEVAPPAPKIAVEKTPEPRAELPRIEVPRPEPPIAKHMAPPAPSTGMLFDEPTLDEPVLSPAERPQALATLAAEVAVCVRCPQLAATRTQTVFGTGSPNARLMFIGEAPGADEDRLGMPFVGRAGTLLTDMITKGMGLSRDEVYIANILKSRPPENRPPMPDEVAHCLPYLERQIAIIRPEFLCLLGKTAIFALLETALPMGRLRGKWYRYRGIPTVVTWHPAYLLRNPAAKRETWEDLQLLMEAMGLKGPDRKKSP